MPNDVWAQVLELILFCGLQGAGKTTFYNQHLSATHLRLSLDMLRTRRRERLILAACLEGGQRCVVDNTNPTIAERAPYIAAAKAHHFAVVAYYFDVSADTCLVRNAGRSGKARVPDRGLLATRAKLQVPSCAEGFARVYRIGLDADGVPAMENDDAVR